MNKLYQFKLLYIVIDIKYFVYKRDENKNFNDHIKRFITFLTAISEYLKPLFYY